MWTVLSFCDFVTILRTLSVVYLALAAALGAAFLVAFLAVFLAVLAATLAVWNIK